MDMEMAASLNRSINSALDKLQTSMDDGPDGDPAVLTPAEATTLYRILTEVYGVKHHPKGS